MFTTILLCVVLQITFSTGADPCSNYKTISDSWRNVANKVPESGNSKCDDYKGLLLGVGGWYRVSGAAGNKLADTCVGPEGKICGTYVLLWLSGGHPTQKDGIVRRRICAHFDRSCCYSYSAVNNLWAQVIQCPGGYYVYNLPVLTQGWCSKAYCTVRDICLDSKCTGVCRVDNGVANCTCPVDLLLASDGYNCVKPCSISNGGCSHNCTNTANGTAICSCPPHLGLDVDLKLCELHCSLNHGGCSHYCLNGQQGPVCSCPNDLILQDNNTTCVNPCDVNNGSCSHTCTNHAGSVVCSCPKGMVIKADRKTCSNNECSTKNGGCSHICKRGELSDNQHCECPKNMVLKSDGKTCQYKDAPCQVNPCSTNATCKSVQGSLHCVCNEGFLGDGLDCATLSTVNLKRCGCNIHVDSSRTRPGPHVFELPTLLYGRKDLWAVDDNGTFRVIDRYPKFYSHLLTKRDVSVENELRCLKVLRNCPQDCERLAKLVVSDGLSTTFQVKGSNGYLTQPLGKIMCDRLQSSLYPGKRPSVFYNPGQDCGQEVSTSHFEAYLCCNIVNFAGTEIMVWNAKCREKVKIEDLISG